MIRNLSKNLKIMGKSLLVCTAACCYQKLDHLIFSNSRSFENLLTYGLWRTCSSHLPSSHQLLFLLIIFLKCQRNNWPKDLFISDDQKVLFFNVKEYNFPWKKAWKINEILEGRRRNVRKRNVRQKNRKN